MFFLPKWKTISLKQVQVQTRTTDAMGSILANRKKIPASIAIVLALLCACFIQQNIPIMSVDATNNVSNWNYFYSLLFLKFVLKFRHLWIQVQIIYMRQRPLGEDPTVIIEKSHHRMLAAVLGRYVCTCMVMKKSHVFSEALNWKKKFIFLNLSKEAAADALLYSYKHGISGFAAKLTESQAEIVAGILF